MCRCDGMIDYDLADTNRPYLESVSLGAVVCDDGGVRVGSCLRVLELACVLACDL